MVRITRSKIASLYGVSRQTLINWINGNPSLLEELRSHGYNDQMKVLSPIMFETVKKYLGEPPIDE